MLLVSWQFHETPLVTASSCGDIRIMRLLLEAGADVNITDIEGYTALHWMAHHDMPDMAADLLARGADPFVAAKVGASVHCTAPAVVYVSATKACQNRLSLAPLCRACRRSTRCTPQPCAARGSLYLCISRSL
jgi:ankyrin repeat protein